MTNFLRTLCVILIGISVGFLAYKKIKSMDFEKSQAMTNAGMVKKMILKYKKPARIEVQNFVKDADSRFQKVIQCRFLDAQSKNLIQEQSLNLF